MDAYNIQRREHRCVTHFEQWTGWIGSCHIQHYVSLIVSVYLLLHYLTSWLTFCWSSWGVRVMPCISMCPHKWVLWGRECGDNLPLDWDHKSNNCSLGIVTDWSTSGISVYQVWNPWKQLPCLTVKKGTIQHSKAILMYAWIYWPKERNLHRG